MSKKKKTQPKIQPEQVIAAQQDPPALTPPSIDPRLLTPEQRWPGKRIVKMRCARCHENEHEDLTPPGGNGQNHGRAYRCLHCGLTISLNAGGFFPF